MIHREALSSKTLPINKKSVLQILIKMVNFIKKSALNTRIFRLLYQELNSTHKGLFIIPLSDGCRKVML